MQDREAPDPPGDGEEAKIFAAALDGARAPRATYRVQLQPGFGFAAAADLASYLDDLGVSDLYPSPFFKAVSGSLHGYDLVDPNRLNPELGGPASFDDLTRRLRARGMGLLLDFVPNPMGVARGENAYWNDVLANGPSSIHAQVFDIDWAPLKSELARRVLLPLLDAPFGKALERGDLRPAFEDGALVVRLHGAKAVFAEMHRLLFELIAAGKVTGLRVDHPDGLREPSRYFSRVQRGVFVDRARLAGADPALLERLTERYDRDAAERPLRPLYMVAEKILARGEELPAAWAVHGTSGYDFAALLGGLFVDAANEGEITRIYERFVGPQPDRSTLIHDGKRLILETALAGELNVLAHALNRLSERDRHTRDFTLGTLTTALREVCACFPVYRTYVGEETTAIAPGDRAAIGVAIRLARRRDPTTDASVYDFLRSVLLRELPEAIAEADRRRLFPFVMKVQQLTSAVMAKGVEDTAFYVYNRLVSLNEVGNELDRFGAEPAELQQANQERLARWPRSLLTTSTHDTKRSEDVRARISVLSELPAAWEAALEAMARAARPLKTARDGPAAPDANRAQDRVAGRARFLPGQRALGRQPRRSRQPAAGELRGAEAGARRADRVAGRADRARARSRPVRGRRADQALRHVGRAECAAALPRGLRGDEQLRADPRRGIGARSRRRLRPHLGRDGDRRRRGSPRRPANARPRRAADRRRVGRHAPDLARGARGVALPRRAHRRGDPDRPRRRRRRGRRHDPARSRARRAPVRAVDRRAPGAGAVIPIEQNRWRSNE